MPRLQPRLVTQPAGPLHNPPLAGPLVGFLEVLRAACQGQTVFVLASGPSLTQADVAMVQAGGYPTIVTNTTFLLAPWATALFGQDRKWWTVYHDQARAQFAGLLLSGQPAVLPGVSCVKSAGIDTFKNSGTGAIALAVHAGAARVICLGLDGQPGPDGARHWHGAHPPGLGNAVSMTKLGRRGLTLWQEQFQRCAAWCRAKGVPVINASRATAITDFPRHPLEHLLSPSEAAP